MPIARQADETADLAASDPGDFVVGQARRPIAGHQQAGDVRGPEHRIPTIDDAHQDVGWKQADDPAAAQTDARCVGVVSKPHQPDAHEVLALRFGLCDGPKAHFTSSVSLSITAPTMVEGFPSCSRVIAWRMVSIVQPCCRASDISTAPSRATASRSVPALAPEMNTSPIVPSG